MTANREVLELIQLAASLPEDQVLDRLQMTKESSAALRVLLDGTPFAKIKYSTNPRAYHLEDLQGEICINFQTLWGTIQALSLLLKLKEIKASDTSPFI